MQYSHDNTSPTSDRWRVLLHVCIEALADIARWAPGLMSIIICRKLYLIVECEKLANSDKSTFALIQKIKRYTGIPLGAPRQTRILCLDGGGTRGVIALKIMMAIEKQLQRPFSTSARMEVIC